MYFDLKRVNHITYQVNYVKFTHFNLHSNMLMVARLYTLDRMDDLGSLVTQSDEVMHVICRSVCPDALY